MTPLEISEQCGISKSVVGYYRKQLGLPLFKRGRPKGTFDLERQERIKQAKQMKIDGATYAEIGKKLGITRQCAQQYLRYIPEVRATHCSLCGKTARQIHYHHTDYSNDTAIPLCPSCHMKSHDAKWLHRTPCPPQPPAQNWPRNRYAEAGRLGGLCGGRSASPSKQEASRRNGRKGGRPKGKKRLCKD